MLAYDRWDNKENICFFFKFSTDNGSLFVIFHTSIRWSPTSLVSTTQIFDTRQSSKRPPFSRCRPESTRIFLRFSTRFPGCRTRFYNFWARLNITFCSLYVPHYTAANKKIIFRNRPSQRRAGGVRVYTMSTGGLVYPLFFPRKHAVTIGFARICLRRNFSSAHPPPSNPTFV